MSPPTKYLCIAVNCLSRFHAFSKLTASLKTSCERSVGTRYRHWLFVKGANDRGVIETTCAPSYSTCNCSLEDQTAEHITIIIIIMYIYHAFINALGAHMIHINLNTVFYIHVVQRCSLLQTARTNKWLTAVQLYTHQTLRQQGGTGEDGHIHILQRCPFLQTARTKNKKQNKNVCTTAVQLHTKLYGSR